MRWKNKVKHLLFADITVFLSIVALMIIFRPDMVLVAVYVLIFPYLYVTGRKSAFFHLIVSSIVGLIWVLIANNQYGYGRDMIRLFGLHTFPLLAWPLGLLGAYLAYSYAEHKIKITNRIKKFILFIVMYWSLLIASETIAYHVFIFRNVATSMYAGLPLCDCIHAPWWMQLAYVAMGPIYFGICEVLGLENALKIKKNKRKK
jgi:hypothetical protein